MPNLAVDEVYSAPFIRLWVVLREVANILADELPQMLTDRNLAQVVKYDIGWEHIQSNELPAVVVVGRESYRPMGMAFETVCDINVVLLLPHLRTREAQQYMWDVIEIVRNILWLYRDHPPYWYALEPQSIGRDREKYGAYEGIQLSVQARYGPGVLDASDPNNPWNL